MPTLTYTNSSGWTHEIDTNLTLAEAITVTTDAVANGELLSHFEEKALSLAQSKNPPEWACFFTIKGAHERQAQMGKDCLQVGLKVHALLDLAAQKLRYPCIRVQKIAFTRAGEDSKNAGCVYAVLRENEKTYLGKIDSAGFWRPGRLGEPFTALIHDYCQDPVGKAQAEGILTGICCFCGRFLTTRESVTAGYGPVCAENFGLPWGKTKSLKFEGTLDQLELTA